MRSEPQDRFNANIGGQTQNMFHKSGLCIKAALRSRPTRVSHPNKESTTRSIYKDGSSQATTLQEYETSHIHHLKTINKRAPSSSDARYILLPPPPKMSSLPVQHQKYKDIPHFVKIKNIHSLSPPQTLHIQLQTKVLSPMSLW